MPARITQIQINEKAYALTDATAREDITNFYKNYPQLQFLTVDGSSSSAYHTINTTSDSTYSEYDIMQIRKFIINTSNCSVFIVRPYFQAQQPSSAGRLLTSFFCKKSWNEGLAEFTGNESTFHMLKRTAINVSTVRFISCHTQFLDPSDRNKYWNTAIGAKTSIALKNIRCNLQSFLLTKDAIEVSEPTGTNTISKTITLNKNL